MVYTRSHFSTQVKRLPQSHSPPSSAQLFQKACASLDRGSDVLAEAAAGLSSTLLDVQANATRVKPRRKKRGVVQPRVSPHFRVQPVQKEQKNKKKDGVASSLAGPQVSPYFMLPSHKANAATVDIPTALDPSVESAESLSHSFTPPGLSFTLQPALFGLIQERICGDLFALVVQAILWNKTRGIAARPVLWTLLRKYPTPDALASADVTDVEEITRKLGLQQVRARRLVDMAKAWIAAPPTAERRYGRRHYPTKGSNPAVKDGELLGPDDEREGWEIGHLPGVGEYALDSFRIFGRDRLRGVAETSSVEPEWKRLVPKDKELGPYVRWKWAQEGWDYEIKTGKKKRL